MDGFRRRLRYLSRKVYLGAVVVLITAMRCGPSPARIRLLHKLVGGEPAYRSALAAVVVREAARDALLAGSRRNADAAGHRGSSGVTP